MKKSVVIINDELGTMALGFSKAGYSISAIYLNLPNRNSVQIYTDNWKDTIDILDLKTFDNYEIESGSDVDFLAGRIIFHNFSAAGSRRKDKNENRTVAQIISFLHEKRPKYFLFQCNRISDNDFVYRQLYGSAIEFGYAIRYECIDTRLFTGLPVNEKAYIIFGSLEASGIIVLTLGICKVLSGIMVMLLSAGIKIIIKKSSLLVGIRR